MATQANDMTLLEANVEQYGDRHGSKRHNNTDVAYNLQCKLVLFRDIDTWTQQHRKVSEMGTLTDS